MARTNGFFGVERISRRTPFSSVTTSQLPLCADRNGNCLWARTRLRGGTGIRLAGQAKGSAAKSGRGACIFDSGSTAPFHAYDSRRAHANAAAAVAGYGRRIIEGTMA